MKIKRTSGGFGVGVGVRYDHNNGGAEKRYLFWAARWLRCVKHAGCRCSLLS